MNEADYLRQQLRTQRAHLREMLELPRQNPQADTPRRAAYLAWAGQRLKEVHDRHRALLPGRVPAHTALPEPPQLPAGRTQAGVAAHPPRAQTGTAATEAAPDILPANRPAISPAIWPDTALAALLTACEQLEQLAEGCYRITDWRQAAQLSADAILEEQHLYHAVLAQTSRA